MSDLYSTSQTKRLLAQGYSLQRHDDRVTEQDKANERMRQMPFHMHINVDLLDGVYLVCAMLLEVPNLAMFDDKRHTISKQFRRYLDAFQRQIFSGPPENTRDYVLAATQALSAGEWKLCVQHVFALKMWSVMPHREHVSTRITELIKNEALHTFLLTFASATTARVQAFGSLSAARLAEMFELSEQSVHRIVSKMILSEELAAAWHQPSGCLLMTPSDPNAAYHRSALRFADKVTMLVDQNERLLDQRSEHKKDQRTTQRGFGRSGTANARRE